MNNNRSFILLCLMLSGAALMAQPDSIQFLCKDVVNVQGGNRFVGSITQMDSTILKIQTWNGLTFTVPVTTIKNIQQECVPRRQKGSIGWRPVRPPFKETGIYHHSRVEITPGLTGAGLSFHHSSGYRFSRWLHAGIGTGVETLDLFEEPAAYPLFLECRTFLSGNRISPYLAAAGGWTWMNKSGTDDWTGQTETWKGGWMAQIQAGYRFGNHFVLYTGMRIQQQERTWSQPWGNLRGVDKILKRRMELGIGLYL